MKEEEFKEVYKDMRELIEEVGDSYYAINPSSRPLEAEEIKRGLRGFGPRPGSNKVFLTFGVAVDSSEVRWYQKQINKFLDDLTS